MKVIRLNLKKRSYNIVVGSDIIRFLGRYTRKLNLGLAAYIITNASIKNKYGKVLTRSLKNSGIGFKFRLIPDTEKSKSLKIASLVLKDLVKFEKRRQVFIIAFGGGVIGDLSGFIASIYKRGIPYIQVPTTLLAQVDSGIGGKTAVDLPEAKNLIGTFCQPRLVFSDVNILTSLDSRQMRSGLAEVIKYAVVKDARLFRYLEKKYRDILAFKQSSLEFIVKRCSYIKANIIRQDEREEKGLRTILNFGHTLGHAIEAAAGYKKYNHGEAIALGMLLASDISNKLGFINNEISHRIENLIKSAGLPSRIKRISLKDIIEAHYRDKKFIGYKNRFVLIENIGRTKITKNIPLKVIKEALKKRV